MEPIIPRRQPKQIEIKAWIEMATVSVTALCSDDVVPKLNLQPADCLARGPEEENTRMLFETTLPVLAFSEELLHVDGFVANRLLQTLWDDKGERWFIFGAFRSESGKRYHIVLPCGQVPKCLAVLDWEILKWTKKISHQF